MIHETNQPRPLAVGSLPPLPELLSLTGPLDLETLEYIYSTASVPQSVLDMVINRTEPEIVVMLYTCLWILRGRNGLVINGDID